jgi:hypothetical protein
MDLLSGTVSGMAVISLSLQLIKSVHAVHAFIQHTKDVQKELARLADVLERFGSIL